MIKVLLLAVACNIFLSGCLIPALTGVKEIRKDKEGNTTYSFITGADLSFGVNGIDNVKNTRGINNAKN